MRCRCLERVGCRGHLGWISVSWLHASLWETGLRWPRASIGDVIPIEAGIRIPCRCRDIVEDIAIIVHPWVVSVVVVSERPIWGWEDELVAKVRGELALLGTVSQILRESEVVAEDIGPVRCVSRKRCVDLQVAATNGGRVERDTGKVVVANITSVYELFIVVSSVQLSDRRPVPTALAMYGIYTPA